MFRFHHFLSFNLLLLLICLVLLTMFAKVSGLEVFLQVFYTVLATFLICYSQAISRIDYFKEMRRLLKYLCYMIHKSHSFVYLFISSVIS